MNIELNTRLVPMFSGTYGTYWDGAFDEVQEEYQGEYIWGYGEYNHDEFMQSIVQAYKNREDEILESLNVPFIKRLTFTGEWSSPREYNFTTDSIYFDIEVDENEMMQALEGLRNDTAFAEFLREHYASRSGFISFTPDNYDDLVKQIKQEVDPANEHVEYEQSVGALVRYLAERDGELVAKSDSNGWNIEMDTYEYWSSNGYCGLNYTFVGEVDGQEVRI